MKIINLFRKYFTPLEVCDMIGISFSSVVNNCKTGKIRTIQKNNRLLIPKSELKRLSKRN